jgi:hypothetical protein
MELTVAIDVASSFVYGAGAGATRVRFATEDARPFVRVNRAAAVAGRAPPYEIDGASVAVWVRPKSAMRAHVEGVLARAEVYAYFNGSNDLCRALLEQVGVVGGRALADLGVQFVPTTARNQGLPVANLVAFAPEGCRFVRSDRTLGELPPALARLAGGALA